MPDYQPNVSYASYTSTGTPVAVYDPYPQYLLPSEGDAAIAAALAASLVGKEAAYAERLTNFTTTNTSLTSTAASSLITELTCSVTGIGRAVEIEFWCGAAYSSVAANYVDPYLVVDGVASSNDGSIAAVSSPVTNSGRTIIMKRRLVIPTGVTRVFQVGIAGQSGTSTIVSGPTGPTYLSVVYR